jgi:exopolysaccharide biosynthesis polyprenyl glycosylphosphotransferase
MASITSPGTSTDFGSASQTARAGNPHLDSPQMLRSIPADGHRPGIRFEIRHCYIFFLKRCLDVLVAAVVLLLLVPLLMCVAAAIRLDSPGPVIFRQTRIGKNNRPFTMYKFRTMVHTPNSGLVFLVDEDGTLRHKVRHDSRITRVGRWIRRTSIDELPQLINVLRGQMSLVGPRPELPEIVSTYDSWQYRRHLVRPGLTGWWQVNGRSNLPMQEHTDFDIYYVENQSFWLDLKILLQTAIVVARGFGAF